MQSAEVGGRLKGGDFGRFQPCGPRAESTHSAGITQVAFRLKVCFFACLLVCPLVCLSVCCFYCCCLVVVWFRLNSFLFAFLLWFLGLS